VFQAINLVNNYGQRKSARTFASRQEASNKLYTVLQNVVIRSVISIFLICLYDFQVLNCHLS
jgi:hypothetical protein